MYKIGMGQNGKTNIKRRGKFVRPKSRQKQARMREYYVVKGQNRKLKWYILVK